MLGVLPPDPAPNPDPAMPDCFPLPLERGTRGICGTCGRVGGGDVGGEMGATLLYNLSMTSLTLPLNSNASDPVIPKSAKIVL